MATENQTANDQKDDDGKNRKNGKKRWTILLLMLLLLAVLFVVQCQLAKIKEAAEQGAKDEAESAQRFSADSIARYRDSLRIDSIARADSLARAGDSLARLDSLSNAQKAAELTPEEKARLDSLAKRKREIRDSIDQANRARKDSLALADSLRKADSLAYANRDSIPPEATIVPPTGRYYEPIKLKVKCDEIKCKTFYSVGDTAHSQELTDPVEYNKTGDVFYAAEDSAGNRSAWQSAHYDMASDNVCGKNAYPVPVNGKMVCVDAYEYPNEPDAVVKDMVSHGQAVEFCAQAGKRLCEFSEWSAACKGKDGSRYSYGNSYKPFKCNTNGKAAKRAGRKEQCRSWYGMYDMDGNLWEWTNTPAPKMESRFLVAGGAWDTQNESRCTDSKFSFYPQNQYNFVGFRCCADAK